MPPDARIRKLRWMCRRGMKELDVLLESFIAQNESRLNAGEWPEMEHLLALEDDVLWDRLRDNDLSPNPEYRGLIEAIRCAPGARA